MKCFSIAMLIIGTVIGAGFSSGAELVAFFGSEIPYLVAPLSGVLIFLLSVMFMSIGTKIRAKNISAVNCALFKRTHFIFDILLLVNSVIVLAGMLAGVDALFSAVFPLKPLYSIMSGILALMVVSKGLKGLLNCNKTVVPIIIAVMVVICVMAISGAGKSGYDPDAVNKKPEMSFLSAFKIIIYICMNMMLASTVLTTFGELDKKTTIGSSLIAAVIMTALISLLIFALRGNALAKTDMPILYIAKSINPGLYGLMLIVIAVSIFTTMLTSMSGIMAWFNGHFRRGRFLNTAVLLGALILAQLGFSKVVSLLYPVIGGIGLLYTLGAFWYVVKNTRAVSSLIERIKSSRESAKPRNAFFKKRHADVHDRG